MSQKIISANRIFDGVEFHSQAQIVVAKGKIVAIEPIDGRAGQHINGIIAPGFIDLQVNGGGGTLLNSEPTLVGIKTIVAAHRQYGTSAMLPTLITDTIDVMTQAADAIALAIRENTSGVLGIHFEGPHLSIAKKAPIVPHIFGQLATPNGRYYRVRT